MNRRKEWWFHPVFTPAWWVLDRCLDGAFYVWDAIDKSSQRWEKK